MKVHHKKKSNGVRVYHEKDRWGGIYHEKEKKKRKCDGVRVHDEEERWGESSP